MGWEMKGESKKIGREGQGKESGTGVRVCVCISVRRGDRASPIGGVFIRWKMKYDLLALYHTSIFLLHIMNAFRYDANSLQIRYRRAVKEYLR
jgi:hypothetical protein